MKKIINVFCFLMTYTIFLSAQSELVVNTYVDSTQRAPAIARDAIGNYIIVWKSINQISSTSKGDIFFQRFNSSHQCIGGETIVNTFTNGEQDKPAVAMNGNGDFVVVWSSYTNRDSMYDIKARLFKNSIPLGNEFIVNSFIPNSQTNPRVDIDESGKFIIAWDSWYQDGGDKGVYAQRFNSDGSKLGTEFRLNTTTAYSQSHPVVKWMNDGKFVTIWESWNQDAIGGYGMIGRIFNSDATPSTSEFQINTYTANFQWLGDVEVMDDNAFIVVWTSWGQDGYDGGIYLQKFSPTGIKNGNEALVNKTVGNYQWIPRIKKTSSNSFVIIWASYKQDGNREGVYAILFDSNAKPISFEIQVNDYTDNYQWEPDAIGINKDEILAIWSTWGKVGKDYEIASKRIKFILTQAKIKPTSINHTSGRSTASILAHVVDSTALTGDSYEVNFELGTDFKLLSNIVNITKGDSVVKRFPLDRGKSSYYITQIFQGIAVEYFPEFELGLDFNRSYFINNSGANCTFEIAKPTLGSVNIAPIDVALIWGRTDTTAQGTFIEPLDTALGTTGRKEVIVPFKAWNLTDNQRVDLLVGEVAQTLNKRWDAGERIIIMTPPPYRVLSTNTHTQLKIFLSAVDPKLPNRADTNIVLTTRPLTVNDKYRFTTSRSNIVDAERLLNRTSMHYELYQNYPNPFNPSTAINYQLLANCYIQLKVFDTLGRQIETLVDGIIPKGRHTVHWDALKVASGVYFYSLRYDNKVITKKMVVVK